MEVNADELAKTLLITEAKVQRETSKPHIQRHSELDPKRGLVQAP